MSDKDNFNASDKLAAKKAAILEAQNKKRMPIVPIALVLLVLGVVGFFGMKMMPEEEKKPATGAIFGYVPKSGEVSYPLSDFDGETARFYQQKGENGVVIRYFINVDENGAVTAAFDTCAECWSTGRGHRQEGDKLVCQSCDKTFDLATFEMDADPCKPLSLPSTVRGDRVVVAIPDLLTASKYFKNFKGVF